MKTCPFCANQIQDAAIKCQFCGEWVGTPDDSTLRGSPPPVASAPPPTAEPLQPAVAVAAPAPQIVTRPAKPRRHPVQLILLVAGLLYFLAVGIYGAGNGNLVSAGVSAGCALIFALFVPVAWALGDAFRRFAMPTRYRASGAIDLAKKKLFWMIGPQSVGVVIAFVLPAALAAAAADGRMAGFGNAAPPAAFPAPVNALANSLPAPQADAPPATASGPLTGAPWGVAPNMTYVVARRALLLAGFYPVPMYHDPDAVLIGSGSDLGKAFPEVVNCRAVGAGGCDFLFRQRSTGAYLDVGTAGEDGDEGPGAGMGVVSLSAVNVTPRPGHALEDQDITAAGDVNFLDAAAPWKRDDQVISQLNQGPDGSLLVNGSTNDQPTVPVDGVALLARIRQAGYHVQGFSRALGYDVRIDLTKPGAPGVVRIYVTTSADMNAGVPTITKVETPGRTYEDQDVKAWVDGWSNE